MENKLKAEEKLVEAQAAVFSQTLTLITGAFALVAALAWNEAVKALIERVFPSSSGVISKFLYAVTITVVVVIITRYIKRVENRYKQEGTESNNKKK